MQKKSISLIFVLSLIVSSKVLASFHLWDIAEVYSNTDGTIQYVELFTSFNGQEFLSGHQLAATSDGSTVTFTFPGSSGSPTANHSLLIATSNFAAQTGAVTPDFILPDNFINPNATNIVLNFGLGQDSISFTGADLPSDGVNSMDRNLISGINTPTNFNGDVGQLDPNTIFSNGFE